MSRSPAARSRATMFPRARARSARLPSIDRSEVIASAKIALVAALVGLAACSGLQRKDGARDGAAAPPAVPHPAVEAPPAPADSRALRVASLDEAVAEYCRLTNRPGLPQLDWFFSFNFFTRRGKAGAF